MSMTPAQAYAVLRAAGATPSQAALLTAIGGAESGLNPAALGDVAIENATWGPSVGVWQIRTLKAQTGTGSNRDASALQSSVLAQAKAAVATLNQTGPSAWSTYTSGAYTRFTGAAVSGGAAANAAYQTAGLDWGKALGALGGTVLGGIMGGSGGAGGALGGMLGNLGGDGGAGALGGAIGGAASSAAGSVASALWSNIQPFALTAMFALGGVALVVIGMTVLAKPAVEKSSPAQSGEGQQAAQLALLA